MKSPVVKRSIVITGHKTSVSLEDAFWTGLKDIAGSRNMTLSELVASIDGDRRQGNLSSAIRLFVLDHYRNHNPAGPGVQDRRDAGAEQRRSPHDAVSVARRIADRAQNAGPEPAALAGSSRPHRSGARR